MERFQHENEHINFQTLLCNSNTIFLKRGHKTTHINFKSSDPTLKINGIHEQPTRKVTNVNMENPINLLIQSISKARAPSFHSYNAHIFIRKAHRWCVSHILSSKNIYVNLCFSSIFNYISPIWIMSHYFRHDKILS